MKGKSPLAEEEEKEEFRFSPRPNRAGEIAWRSWGKSAFEEARAQGKLVLLSISAVWCHWCHVMDETVFRPRDNRADQPRVHSREGG